MLQIGLYSRLQGGLKNIGQVRVLAEDVRSSDDYQMEPDGVLTLEQVREVCEQHRAYPEVRYGTIGKYEWQEIGLPAASPLPRT